MAPRKISIATLIAAQADIGAGTKAVCGLAHNIYPDVGVSYHTYSQLILHLWGYTVGRGAAAQNEYSVAVSIAVEASVQISAVHGMAYRAGAGPDLLYVVNGDFVDWMFGVFGAYGYTRNCDLPRLIFIRLLRKSSPPLKKTFPPPYILFAPPFCTTVP